VIGILLLIVFFGTNAATLYTDYLWFCEVGHRQVFLHVYGTRILLFSLFGFASFVIAGINLRLASHFSPAGGVGFGAKQVVFPRGGERPIGRGLQLLFGLRTVLNLLYLLGSVIFANIAGLTAQTQWDSFLRFMNPVPFGIRDPQFGRDMSFYIFTLPFIRYMQGWLMVILLLVGAGVMLVYLYQEGINAAAGRAHIAPHVRAHLSVIAACVFFVKAWSYYLDRFDLMYGDGLVPGAGFSDVHARLPMLNLLVGITVLVGIAIMVNAWRRTFALPLAAFAAYLAFSAAGVVIPGTVQRLQVRPNEGRQEAPYIARAIAATRHAYDVADVQVSNFPAETSLTAADLARNRATVDNIRLWDYEPLLETYPQQQGLRQYYQFPDIDVDRYRLQDGSYLQVLLSGREIAPDKLDSRAQTWPNLHLRYTHGFGAVLSPAGRTTSEGLPTYLVRDIPPVSSDPVLAIKQPRIYFGTDDEQGSYVVVNSRQAEFDYPEDTPAGPADRENRYDGGGGIALTPLAKFAFAARFAGWTNLMLSSDITPESRLLFARRIPDRVKRIAPFLKLDHDPYLVIADGKLTWIQDCYTSSDVYPYSAPTEWTDDLGPGGTLNYIRNSVKVSVDAYTGSLTLFVTDPTDPIIRSYERIFPGLFQPASAMPAALRSHLRFPEDLFSIQRRILADYHVTDPGVFYARADSWQLPQAQANVESGADNADTVLAPYYVMTRLPGEKHEEFALLSPFTPRDRQNMVGLLAARCDGDNYGKRILYRFPTSRTVYGPEQVGKQIRSDSKISPYLSLNDQKGSRVIFGSMLIVPIEKSLLYVQPVYVKAQTSDVSGSIPELKQVIVAFDNRIAMEPTLAASLTDLFGAGRAAAPATSTPAVAAPPVGPAATVPALIQQAGAEYDRAQAALRAGDFAAYGRESGALGKTLEQLRKSGVR
jgi:uncharacterized membrane protein (UPF0182 family)